MWGSFDYFSNGACAVSIAVLRKWEMSELTENKGVPVASPGEMVAAVASVLGVAKKTVTDFDRHLSVAGLRSKSGRGNSAARVTAQDCARLLIAMSATSGIREGGKDAVAVTTEFSALPAKGGEISGNKDGRRILNGNAPNVWDLGSFPLPRLSALPQDHTFLDALSALIESAADGSVDSAVNALPKEPHIPKMWGFRVMVFGPFPGARITISYPHGYETHHYSAIPSDFDEVVKWSKEPQPARFAGDLKQWREFSTETIRAMGKLLKD